jgi:hypothetical protein
MILFWLNVYIGAAVALSDEMQKIWCISSNFNTVIQNAIQWLKNKILVYICLMKAFHKTKHAARHHWNKWTPYTQLMWTASVSCCVASDKQRVRSAGVSPALSLASTFITSCLPSCFTMSIGCARVQAVSRRISTTPSQFQSQVRTCGIRGGQDGTVACYLRLLRVPYEFSFHQLHIYW